MGETENRLDELEKRVEILEDFDKIRRESNVKTLKILKEMVKCKGEKE